jgi:hypothetical protein
MIDAKGRLRPAHQKMKYLITGKVLTKANKAVPSATICLVGYSRPDPLVTVQFDGVIHRDSCATTDETSRFNISIVEAERAVAFIRYLPQAFTGNIFSS